MFKNIFVKKECIRGILIWPNHTLSVFPQQTVQPVIVGETKVMLSFYSAVTLSHHSLQTCALYFYCFGLVWVQVIISKMGSFDP